MELEFRVYSETSRGNSMSKMIHYVSKREGNSLKYMTKDSAGVDLCVLEPVVILPRQMEMVNTGVSVSIPVGHAGLLFPRSSLSVKKGLMLMNSIGLIDSDYRGDIQCILWNSGTGTVRLETGERIAQLVVIPVAQYDWVKAAVLDMTERGTGGFGSTGGYQS